MASEYLLSPPSGLYCVIDTQPPYRVWGENLSHDAALRLRERVCGEEKSRSAAVKRMQVGDCPTVMAPAAPLPPITHVARNVRPIPPIKSEYRLRFMIEVGTRAELRIYWGATQKIGTTYWGPCPNTYGLGSPGIHNATRFLGDKIAGGYDDSYGGDLSDYDDDMWPTACDHCDAVVPERELEPCNCGTPNCMKEKEGSPHRMLSKRILYQDAAGALAVRGELEAGDMYWATWYDCATKGHCIHGWTNCDGKHLIICCPNSNGSTHPWDVMSRASNCSLPADTTHRCWCLVGDPESGKISVGKTGRTCGAGGGSIQTGDYHGVVSDGVLRTC